MKVKKPKKKKKNGKSSRAGSRVGSEEDENGAAEDSRSMSIKTGKNSLKSKHEVGPSEGGTVKLKKRKSSKSKKSKKNGAGSKNSSV